MYRCILQLEIFNDKTVIFVAVLKSEQFENIKVELNNYFSSLYLEDNLDLFEISENELQDFVNNYVNIIKGNKNKKNYEMLMIKKKHSYNYKDFVLGSYSNINKSYFNNMTLNEKEYIYSNNYDFMWYKLWSKFPNNDNKMRYNRNFKKLYLKTYSFHHRRTLHTWI